ncbi:MAG: flagellar basal body rod protein FlgC [Thermoflavifilum sp.]|nr:flagellar basal body rod protein FlgC [Thermoflavifilum sp.]MCL6513376.1 flagellar basal body rod protein FlgC [Alicyclobacillus sp.]
MFVWPDSFSIAASGLTAQRLRMDVIASNIANAQTTRTPEGGPYRREEVVLVPQYVQTPGFADVLSQAGGDGTAQLPAGVRVAAITQDPSPFQLVYDPTNPDAVNGYVEMPNVDVTTEMVDLISASRLYQANATAFDASKQMAMAALNIGR